MGSKERLFEVMGKVNPDFKNRINEVDLSTEENPNFQLKTYGDLKRTINVIRLQKKGKKLAGIGFDAILNSIPFLGNAKTAYDVYKAALQKPDTKKTNTWLDRIDIDDDTSRIVDDTVEDGFIKFMTNKFNSEPDDKLLEPDFDMNKELVNYLATNYNNRTVKYISPID